MSYQLKQLFSADDVRKAVGKKLSGMEIIFACPIVLDVFFNNEFFELWNFSGDTVNTLVVKKLRSCEIRILFEQVSDDAIEYLKQTFNPPFICYNLLFVNAGKDNQIESQDITVDIPELLKLSDSKMGTKYRLAQKRNTGLSFRTYTPDQIPIIKNFLKSWEQDLLKTKPNFLSGIFHDELFFDRYGATKEVFGVCVYDNEKLVAFNMNINISKILCVDICNKCLRGYQQLGLQLFIERARVVHQHGYTQISLGPINNDFKKQFIPFSKITILYGFEIFRNELFTTKTPNGYTAALYSK